MSWTLKLWIQFTLSVTNSCAPILLFFQVTSRYHWARVLEDCDETVKRCDVCQHTSKKFDKPSAQLHPIKVKDTVWNRIGIDLVGPLPETSRGNKYLITCTCYFSRWPEADPLKSKSAEGTVVYYIHTEIYTLKSRRVNFRSLTDVNQSNVAYRFSHMWEKRYVQSGAAYHVFSRVSRTAIWSFHSRLVGAVSYTAQAIPLRVWREQIVFIRISSIVNIESFSETETERRWKRIRIEESDSD